MKCTKCGKEEILPFRCAYCNQYYCAVHRLPEQHECQAIHLARSPVEINLIESRRKREREWAAPQTFKSVSMKGRFNFLTNEVTHLTIGTLLVMAVGLSLLRFDLNNITIMIILSLGFAMSFLVHELAHKFVGNWKGLTAGFRLNTIGVIITLASIFLPIKFVAPGAVVVRGISNLRELCIVALVGPLANLVISFAFFIALISINFETLLIFQGLRILGLLNAYIAMFNLIPLGQLDGLKIFSYNKTIWMLMFGLSIGLLIIFNYGLFI